MVKYCTLDELGMHNHEGSLWVAIFGRVLDLTGIVANNSGDETRAIVDIAGQDISHWFVQNEDGETDLKIHIHPVTLLPAPFISFASATTTTTSTTASVGGKSSHSSGKVLHVPPPFPRSDFSTDFNGTPPWWQDPSLVVAHLTAKPRKVKIINTLTAQEHILDVCGEESMEDIRRRYLEFNKHASSYSWKRLGVELDMTKTLEENGIVDEMQVYADLRVNDDFYIPAVHLYFVDDLTVE